MQTKASAIPPIQSLGASTLATDGPVQSIGPTGNSATSPVMRSPAAERMRLHRERKRNGLRCLMIELRETEIDTLIKKQLLKGEMRNDTSAIIDALYSFLEQELS